MTALIRRHTALGRAVAGLILALTWAVLTACSSTSDDPSGQETSQPTTDDAPPFAVKLEGPDSASAGDDVTITLTNVGRLPDAYQLTPEPLGAARIAEPNAHASPGESVEVAVLVKQTPVSIVVKSVGGGGGEQVGEVTIN
jgi:hypothetical protein